MSFLINIRMEGIDFMNIKLEMIGYLVDDG